MDAQPQSSTNTSYQQSAIWLPYSKHEFIFWGNVQATLVS